MKFLSTDLIDAGDSGCILIEGSSPQRGGRMHKLVKPILVFLALGAMSQPLSAQVDLTDDRTVDQKWNRAVFLMDGTIHGALSYAKSVGQTPEQLGRFWGEWAGQFWGAPGSMTMASFVRGMYGNYRMYQGLEFEILAESETEIHGRMNIPFKIPFGEEGEWVGVTLEGFDPRGRRRVGQLHR
jgi:hypothetical protein